MPQFCDVDEELIHPSRLITNLVYMLERHFSTHNSIRMTSIYIFDDNLFLQVWAYYINFEKTCIKGTEKFPRNLSMICKEEQSNKS